MGLLQNTSQEQGWNLANELNMDLSTDSLFDDLPSEAKALRGNEVVQSGRELNTSAEGSFVPGSAIAPIETPRSRASADSILREREAQLSGNPLDNFQAPPVRAEEPEGSSETIGGIISRGFGYIEKLKDMKANRFGQKREVGVMKSMDEAAIARTYNIMQDHLRRMGYDDPNLLGDLAKHRGGGYRSAENINRLFEIKSKGTTFQDENGEVIVAPDSEWETIFEADRISRAMSLKSQKTAASDPLKQQQDFLNIFKSWAEARTNAAENPDDRDAQILYKVATNRFKQLAGEDYEVAAFNLGQQEAADLIKYGDQPVRPDGKPTQGLEDKTASQVLAEKINSGNFIPVVDGFTDEKGRKAFDTDKLKSRFPGGEMIEGSLFAVRDAASNSHTPYRVVNGSPVALFSKSLPDTEEATPLDASIKEIEAKEAVANAESNKMRIQEIDREIAALSSTATQRRESSFSPMGYSAPVSSRAKNKDELIRDKNRILELKKLKASLLK